MMSNRPEDKCPQGWDTTELLAYLEKGLDEDARRDWERHLEDCTFCADELKSLGSIYSLLTAHPEALHPDDEALYRFVALGRDSEGKISAHLTFCKRCRDEVELLKEMISESNAIPDSPPILPKSLICKPAVAKSKPWKPIYILEQLSNIRFPKFVPAFSAAATVLIILVVSLSMLPWLKTQIIPQFSGENGFYQDPQERFEERIEESRIGIPEPRQSEATERSQPAASLPAPTVRQPKKMRPESPLSASPESAEHETKREFLYRTKEKQDTESRLFEERPGRARKTVGKDVRLNDAIGDAVPVVLVVEDSEGRPVPWLKVQLPQDLQNRYRLVMAEADGQAVKPSESPAPALPLDSKLEKKQGLRVKIQVHQPGDLYDVSSTLLDIPSNRQIASITEVHVTRENVPGTIESMIRRLLSAR